MRETPTQTSITEIFRYTDPTLTYVLHTDLTTIIIIDHNHFVVFLTLRQTLLPTGQWNTRHARLVYLSNHCDRHVNEPSGQRGDKP